MIKECRPLTSQEFNELKERLLKRKKELWEDVREALFEKVGVEFYDRIKTIGDEEDLAQEVVIVSPDDTVLTAARLMRDYGVGDVVIVKNRKPVGILTDRDIAVRVMAEMHFSGETPVKTVMSADLKTINEERGVGDAIRLMKSVRIRRLPVIDDQGYLVGIITLDDLLELIAEEMDTLTELVRLQQEVARRMVVERSNVPI